MNRTDLLKALFALLLALALLPPNAGTAEEPTRVALLTPGEGSRVPSPILVSAEIHPGPGSLARIELLDRAGRSMARQLLRLENPVENVLASYTEELPFEIPSDEEQALLTFTLLDSYHRTIALRSTRITLLASGEAQIEPTQDDDSWLSLTQPEPLDVFTGGQFTVAGTVKPLMDGPIYLELVADDGRVIGTAQVRVQAAGQTFDFETTLYYSYIKTLTTARLVIRQVESAFSTTAIADSLLLGVGP